MVPELSDANTKIESHLRRFEGTVESPVAHQSPGRNINSCQLTNSVRQARRSWHRFCARTDVFHAGSFLLELVIHAYSHVVLGLPRGLVPFTL